MSATHPDEAIAPEPGAEVPVILVPRITIHAYCESSQLADLIRQTGEDRRMYRAHLAVSAGGLAAAIEAYQSRSSPNLIIVQSDAGREEILSKLATLSEVCQPDTKVIVIGQVNDVPFYRLLIREGVSEYLVAPIQPLNLIEAIANIYSNPNAPPLGRVVAFMGAKGGAGSSTLAQNVSWSISNNEGLDTVLADLDLAFGCAGLNFNQEALPGLTDVLGQPDRVDAMLIERMLIKISDRLNLLSGPGGFERDFQIEPHAIEALFAAMRSSVPYLILDLPAHWAPWTKFALQNAEQVVITTTPDLPGLRNAKNLVDQLMELRPNDQPPVLVINQVGVPKRPEIKAAEFSKAIGIAVAAVIPFDAQSFGNAQTNGQTIFEVSPKSKSALSIDSLARSLTGLGKERQYDGKPAGSLIDKLLGRSRET